MPSPHDRVLELVREGSLSLIWVLGLPRSNSTALHLALTQAPEVAAQLNEPFFHPDHRVTRWDSPPGAGTRSFDDGCAHILALADELWAKGQKPVTLVIHDHAKDLVETEFRAMSALARHFVLALRSPVPAALSLLTRLANEMLADKGRSAISTLDTLGMLRDEASFQSFAAAHPEKVKAQGMGRAAVIGAWRGNNSVAWANVERYGRLLREEGEGRSTPFDGAWLFDAPETHLARTAARAGVTYVPSMLNGWTKGVGDGFRCLITAGHGAHAGNNAWNGPARSSTGVAVKPDSASAARVTLADMPADIQDDLRRFEAIFASFYA